MAENYSYANIAETVEQFRKENANKRIGMLSGTFDILHEGHVILLSEAKKNCDFLIVAITPDKKVGKFKIGRPIRSDAARAMLIENMKGVNAVVISHEKDDQKRQLIEIVKPDVYFLGPDQKDKQSGYIKVHPLFLEKNISTTDIIKKIMKAQSHMNIDPRIERFEEIINRWTNDDNLYNEK